MLDCVRVRAAGAVFIFGYSTAITTAYCSRRFTAMLADQRIQMGDIAHAGGEGDLLQAQITVSEKVKDFFQPLLNPVFAGGDPVTFEKEAAQMVAAAARLPAQFFQ